MNEKERVYAELDATRKKLAKVRREVRVLQEQAGGDIETRLRREVTHYRKALSYIGGSPLAGDDPDFLKRVARTALDTADAASAKTKRKPLSLKQAVAAASASKEGRA